MKKLYIGNLPYQVAEEDLRQWFSQAGINTDSVTLIRDRQTGQPRGFGFVEIGNDEEADRAIASLNGQELSGRRVVINEARPMSPGGGGRGGGRGGYGGGGGGGRPGGGGGRGGGGGGRDRGDRGGGGRPGGGGGRDRYEW